MADKLLYYAVLVVFLMVTYSPATLGAVFDPCSSDANCTDVNGVCNGDMRCICNVITHYEYEKTCLEKIPTGDSCNTSTTCLDLLASCQDVTSGSQDLRCSCNSGYTESGGVCVKDCGNNPSSAVTSGTATLTTPGNTTVGATASVMCDDRFTSATSTITCQDGGQWSSAVCTVSSCVNDLSSAVTSGTATLTSGNTTVGSTASVMCDTGYTSTTPMITCQASGQWSTAVCSVSSCENDPSSAVTLGTATLTTPGNKTIGSTASVMCNTGYTSETSMITCQATGQWSTVLCNIQNCGNNPSLAVTSGNATLTTPGNTTVGSTASVMCDTGYTSPTAVITCQASGEWSTVACNIRNCSNDPSSAVTSGTATLTLPGITKYLSTASVMCDTGYTPETSTIICQASGQWSTAACNIQNCNNPTSITGGTATYASTTYGSTASVSCSPGYENPSPATITCEANGRWSSSSCSRRDCGSSINTITNGRASPSADTRYESTAMVICDTGYKDPTPQRVTCQSDGNWSSSSCTIEDCGSPSDISNGGVSVTKTTYQGVATYTCDTGYIISGTSQDKTKQDKTTTRTCNAIGAWSGQLPVCTVKVNPLGAVCPNPSLTNVPPAGLCIEENALCSKKSENSMEYTCQCDTLYYDNNGDGAGGSCNTISELQVQSITFDSISTTSMTVSWSPPANKQSFVDSYMVEWRDNSNSPQSSSSLVPGAITYTISNSLTSGRAYTVKVITRNSVDYTSTIKTTFLSKEQAIKPQIPGAINNGSSNLNVVDKAILVVWNGSAGDVSGYEWKLQDGNTELDSGITTTSRAYINYSGIKNGYRYNIAITALSQMFDNRKTVRSETHTEEIKTVVTVPSKPQQVECHTTTDTSVTIKWREPQLPNGDLKEYMIDTYVYDTNTKLKTDTTGDLALTYEITGLQPGSYYFFYVYTINEQYHSQPATLSTPSSPYCETRANVSDIPNNLKVDKVQSRSFVVSWTKPTDTYGENMGYVVQVRTDDACVMELIMTCNGCTRSFNPSSLENMCPSGVSITEQRTKTSIDSDDVQMYTVTSLKPYVSYTVTVTAVNNAGRGRIASVTVQTDEEVPQKPKDVTLSGLTPTSCNVTWNIDGPRPGYTTWVVIVDAVLPATNSSYPLIGFPQRGQALTNLQEYWNYTVTIKAMTSKGSNLSDSVMFTTLPSAPGPVDGFNVITSPGGSTVQVQWKIPTLLERNSQIATFILSHNTSSDGSMQEISLDRNSDDEYLYDVVLNVTPEMTYQFQVYAINVANETGEEGQITIEAPAGIPFNSFETIENKSVIPAEAIVPSQTTLKLSIDKGFYDQNSRGSVTLTGLIGCAKDKCSGDAIRNKMSVDEFNSLDNWHKASAGGYTKYRITRSTWRDEPAQTRRKRQANENTEDYIVGIEPCDDTMKAQYCNGPLQPATSYIIHVVICTSGGCLISNEYGPFATSEVPPEDSNLTLIIVVVVSVVVVAAIVIVVVVFILRRRRAMPKMTRMGPEQPKVDEMTTTANIQRKRPIRLSVFEDELNILHKDSNLLFSAAYDDLRTLAPTHPQEAANREENRLKNRYINILPFDHSRVKLFSNGEEESSDYINANYLPGYRSPREYIGCQGPIPGTIDDFWRMVWEQNVSIIVMLTLCKEGQKIKCEQYWPDETREPKQYGDVVVEVTSTSTIQTYNMRIFKITNGSKTRTVKHFHFLSWLDFQANVKHDIILDFITHVRSHVQPPDTAGPMIVHCSAGVGRTGTYVCLDHLMQFIDEHDFDVSVDIFDMVLKLRENRPLMVQTEQQYVFIHDCVKELMDRKRSKEGIYENQGFNVEDEENIYQNEQGATLYENIQIKTEL